LVSANEKSNCILKIEEIMQTIDNKIVWSFDKKENKWMATPPVGKCKEFDDLKKSIDEINERLNRILQYYKVKFDNPLLVYASLKENVC
jgi:hypothetical protein